MSDMDRELDRLEQGFKKPPYLFDLRDKVHLPTYRVNAQVRDRGVMEDERGSYIAYYIEGVRLGTNETWCNLVTEKELVAGHKIEGEL